VTVVLQWHGGAEPWVHAKSGEFELNVRPDTKVWELVLRLNGWS